MAASGFRRARGLDGSMSDRPLETKASSVPTPATSTALALQRLVGNQAVAQLVAATTDNERAAEHPADGVRSVLAGGGGRSLPLAVQRSAEQILGADFDGVRLHTDPAARASAESLGADAYTVGDQIVLGGDHGDLTGPSSGRLLAHELTHVIQQRSGSVSGRDAGGGLVVSDPSDAFERQADAAASRWTEPRQAQGHGGRPSRPPAVQRRLVDRKLTVQRHASDEHLLLGNMSPDDLKALAEGKATAEARGQGDVGARLKSFFGFNKATPLEQGRMNTATQLLSEQMTALGRWRDTGGPAPSQVRLGSTDYNHTWGGQLVLIDCADGQVPATVGDMNALPDFFGSLADAKSVSKSVLQGVLQVIRREAWMSLENLRMKLAGEVNLGVGKKVEFGRSMVGQGAWKGAESATAETYGTSGPEALANISATERLTRGTTTGGTGRDEDTSYKSTLARNACHFPPESWLRWKEHHLKARAIISRCRSSDDLPQAINDAVTLNAFGEHYLQDSFAGGHLINKGYIMALALEHTSAMTNDARGIGPEQIAEFKRATAHEAAYSAPDKAQAGLGQGRQARRARQDLKAMKATDPQSALDRAKASGDTSGRAEVEAAGLDPETVNIDQYRAFLNDTWYQKLTNALHDRFCQAGLQVASPDESNVFTVYGDYNMLRSAKGTQYTAETSRLSRQAINDLAENKRSALARREFGFGGPTVPVTSLEQIMVRFPNEVIDPVSGLHLSLKDWATGAAMQRLVTDMVNDLMSLNSVIRGASAVKGFSGGLAHDPF